ncbi:hypothetical protein GCM10020216_042760 [Nonomuraea helvata]
MRSFISGKADPQAALTNNRSTAPKRGRGAGTTAMAKASHYYSQPQMYREQPVRFLYNSVLRASPAGSYIHIRGREKGVVL